MTAPTPSPKVGSLVWHIHHDMLVEPLTEPFATRVAYIKAEKPVSEIDTRLRLMKPVWGKLPELDKARAELDRASAEGYKARAEWDRASAELVDKAYAELVDKAYAEWTKARAEWTKARAELDRARASPSVLALHAKECPNCPWNGETIFPPKEGT